MGKFKEGYVETIENKTIGAGLLTANLGEEGERHLGGTRAGSKFTLETETIGFELDGVRGNIKGGNDIVGYVAKLSGNVYNVSMDNIMMALPGAKKTGNKITIGGGNIKETDYFKNIALLGRLSDGRGIVIKIFNARHVGNLELNFADGDDGRAFIAFELVAHYDLADITEDANGAPVWGDLVEITYVDAVV